jgi:DNA-binding transcriptional LysR family regulator
MFDRVPEVSDEIVELLRNLSELPPDSAKLSRALASEKPAPLNFTNAQQAISRLSRELEKRAGNPVNLLETRGRTGTFATPDCRALLPALIKIREEREAAREEDERQWKLEWLRLSSCLENKPLKIGAYQAHAERFMASAVKLMIEYFPWLDCTLEIEPSRGRNGRYAGQLQRRFGSGEFDFILIPRESAERNLKQVYTYSFRVVGHPFVLAKLRAGQDSVHISRLHGHPLIVASEGSSSRQRLDSLLQDAGFTMTKQFELTEENNPNVMRIRAETGQGLAVMSDEYSAVGGSRMDFPKLVRGTGHGPYEVDMGLLRKESDDRPRHRAFNFVVDQLLARERRRERAAAQA